MSQLRRYRWSLMAAGFVAVAIGFLAATWSAWRYRNRVAHIPLIDEPFDVDAFLEENTPSDTTNAASVYREAVKAAKQFFEAPAGGEPLYQPLANADLFVLLEYTHPPEDDEMFLELSREAYERMREAGKLPRAMLRDPRPLYPLEATTEIGELRSLAGMLLKRAEVLAGRGDLAEALQHHLAIIRMGRHLDQMPVHERMPWGAIIERGGLYRLHRWALDVNVTPELAQQAFEQYQNLQPRPPSRGTVTKVQYIKLRHLLDQSQRDQLHDVIAQRLPNITYKGQFGSPRSPLRWPFANWEIERSRRLLRLLTANHLTGYALDPWQRPKQIQPTVNSYVGPFGAFRGGNFSVAGFPDAQRLANWLDRTPLLACFSWPVPDDYVELMRRALAITLAWRAHQLKHRVDPPSLDSLADTYFEKLPTDPYSGRPFGYTVATGQAIPTFTLYVNDAPFQTQQGQRLLYSVGPDGADDGGTVDWAWRYNSIGANAPADWLFPLPISVNP